MNIYIYIYIYIYKMIYIVFSYISTSHVTVSTASKWRRGHRAGMPSKYSRQSAYRTRALGSVADLVSGIADMTKFHFVIFKL